MSFVSYAQNYEDVMLFRALRGIEHGFYIDVGAQDPIGDSVTKAFYERGWRGINIEPVTHWFQRLVADRPHDINLQLAISDAPGVLHLFEVVDSGLSTTDAGFAREHAKAGHQLRESNVECVTLDDICRSQQVGDIHFLKIDCEGGEAAALRGLSLDRIRPWVLLLEAFEPNSQTPAYIGWEPQLIERGYHLVYEDGLNRFYVADEHIELDGAFAYPPNVFDYFVRAPEMVARNELLVAQRDLMLLHDVQHLALAEAERELLRAKADHLHDENERREAALVEHRHLLKDAAEREAQSVARIQNETEHWRTHAEWLRAENEGREQVLGERQQSIAALEETLANSRLAATTALDHAKSLSDGLADLQNEVGRLHREVASRDQEVIRLHGLIQMIRYSTSWRITAPLRLAKGGAHATIGLLYRFCYHLLRWPARLFRPLLRLIARWSWLRTRAVRIAGPDSKLTIYTGLFLFGASPAEHQRESFEAPQSEVPMTRLATEILEEIQGVRKRSRSDSPVRPGRK